MDGRAEGLLIKVLNGDVEWLSEEEKAVLWENRDGVIQRLNAIFSYEIPRLLEEKECLNPMIIYWALRLAGFLKASEAFQWIQRLCYLTPETLDELFGDAFISDGLVYLLAMTMTQWSALKLEIENPALDEFIRSACLEALVYSVAIGNIERLEITEYFKSLFHRILSGELDDDTLCTYLVDTCADFWPGECMEEIRESFGLTLVDESMLDLDSVLDEFSQGKEACIEKLQKQINQYNFGQPQSELSDEEQDQKWERMRKEIGQAEIDVEQALKRPSNKAPERNELCNCGSGLKYKKCCMNKPAVSDSSGKLRVEISDIVYGPLGLDVMKTLPDDDRESILALYHLIKEDPEEVSAVAQVYIEKYPHISALYNYLYCAYRKLGRPHEAMKVLKETVQMFPDYLFGRVEYALYLLRRGESEKAHAALENATTLTQLYPERSTFHVTEWKAFAYAMGLYSIQINDLGQAKMYLEVLQKIVPECPEIEDLESKMRRKLFSIALESLRVGV